MCSIAFFMFDFIECVCVCVFVSVCVSVCVLCVSVCVRVGGLFVGEFQVTEDSFAFRYHKSIVVLL